MICFGETSALSGGVINIINIYSTSTTRPNRGLGAQGLADHPLVVPEMCASSIPLFRSVPNPPLSRLLGHLSQGPLTQHHDCGLLIADYCICYLSGCLTNPSWRSSTAVSLQYLPRLLPAVIAIPDLVLSSSPDHLPFGNLRKQGALDCCPNT